MPVTLGESVEDGVKYEHVNFSGRDTGMGRVTVYGVLATNEKTPARESVLILQDSGEEIDLRLLGYFVKRGYNALCVDYSGDRDSVERYTVYPDNVSYANVESCGRSKYFVDSTAFETCWYEWVAVGIYARKLLAEKFGTENIGLIGIRDGGEIAWKLASAADFSCLVTVGACGWLAYRGFNKFEGKEPEFNDERYRFVAGIDSQAYAPYVRCPVLMLCTTDDKNFDCDRAFDTFSRINPEYARASSIAYSVNCGTVIDSRSTNDMNLFLDSNVKDRHIFMPNPINVSVYADDNEELVAKIDCDNKGIVEQCGVYFSVDSYDSATRDWTKGTLKQVINTHESEYLLNIYEKSTVLFVLCYAVYSNGFTVWSKIAVKRLSGRFRNGGAKSKIVYINKFGSDCFSVSDCAKCAVGGIFLTDDDALVKLVKYDGLSGVYSNCGLLTYRIKSLQFSPEKDSILKFDVCSEEDMTLDVSLKSKTDGQIYTVNLYILGGVWQSQTLRAKVFKNKHGISLSDYTVGESLSVKGSGAFALNNLIWL